MKDSLLQHDTVALNAAKDALHIIDQTFVCQRNFCFISFDFFIRQSDCLAFF